MITSFLTTLHSEINKKENKEIIEKIFKENIEIHLHNFFFVGVALLLLLLILTTTNCIMTSMLVRSLRSDYIIRPVSDDIIHELSFF